MASNKTVFCRGTLSISSHIHEIANALATRSPMVASISRQSLETSQPFLSPGILNGHECEPAVDPLSDLQVLDRRTGAA
jgi:hypothetical protein